MTTLLKGKERGWPWAGRVAGEEIARSPNLLGFLRLSLVQANGVNSQLSSLVRSKLEKACTCSHNLYSECYDESKKKMDGRVRVQVEALDEAPPF